MKIKVFTLVAVLSVVCLCVSIVQAEARARGKPQVVLVNQISQSNVLAGITDSERALLRTDRINRTENNLNPQTNPRLAIKDRSGYRAARYYRRE